MTVRVWVNGELVGDRGSISALDHGVTVAQTPAPATGLESLRCGQRMAATARV